MVNKKFSRKIKKSKSNKYSSTSTKRRTQKKLTQKGGVGFRHDVASGCKIGGLPIINATSDCPEVGHGDKKFAQALYGAGRKQKKTKNSSKKYKNKYSSRNNKGKNK